MSSIHFVTMAFLAVATLVIVASIGGSCSIFGCPEPEDSKDSSSAPIDRYSIKTTEPTAATSVTQTPREVAPTTSFVSKIGIRVLNDIPHLLEDRSEPQDLTTMVHLDAPQLESLDGRRQGIALSAVIDVSGSMQSKIDLMKAALQFMVTQLGSNDSLGIITFASEANELLPMQKMTPDNKRMAKDAINGIRATTSTHLSAGLFAGIRQVAASHQQSNRGGGSALPAARTATVMLFTDGQANVGITGQSPLLEALRMHLTDAPHVVVHTFGFGTDHDALLLQGIAEQSQGSYYFIKDNSVLKGSFADCLGGLVSVVSTGLTLRMTVVNSAACEVVQVMTKFPVTQASDGTSIIAIKDLYSGESRDVPVLLKVRTLGLKSSSVMPLLAWAVEYHSTVDVRTHTQKLESSVLMSHTKFSDTPNVEVDEQRNRFLAVVALDEARQAAASHNFKAARAVLLGVKSKIARTASVHTAYNLALQRELEEVQGAVSDEHRYKTDGNVIHQALMRHRQQRSNDAAQPEGVAMYQTHWKNRMKQLAK